MYEQADRNSMCGRYPKRHFREGRGSKKIRRGEEGTVFSLCHRWVDYCGIKHLDLGTQSQKISAVDGSDRSVISSHLVCAVSALYVNVHVVRSCLGLFDKIMCKEQ